MYALAIKRGWIAETRWRFADWIGKSSNYMVDFSLTRLMTGGYTRIYIYTYIHIFYIHIHIFYIHIHVVFYIHIHIIYTYTSVYI